ncbi:PepSY domain-containing protein [Roseibium sp. Sym1]|uniref:PepSY domain-containing protein n=1 Tax=Roseibium sp. Sym1 TaxID=3016006 RepID=UPI0022B5343F|nr:PepSY domain-containing protein [Roseibium sp. Sym1]
MKPTFKSPALTLFSATGLLASTGIALAAVSVGDTLGNTEDDVRAALSSLGYMVEDIETEDGEIEAEVLMDGQEMDVVVDARSGQVLEMELEDPEGEETDDD